MMWYWNKDGQEWKVEKEIHNYVAKWISETCTNKFQWGREILPIEQKAAGCMYENKWFLSHIPHNNWPKLEQD